MEFQFAGGLADLKAAPGKLRLKSISGSENLWEAGALLTQKLPAERFSATTKLTLASRAVGEQATTVLEKAPTPCGCACRPSP